MEKQQAIDLLDNLIGMVEDNQDNDYDAAFRMAIDALRQPEIVRCGECARRKTMCDGRDRCTVFNVFVDSDGYCKWAERKG